MGSEGLLLWHVGLCPPLYLRASNFIVLIRMIWARGVWDAWVVLIMERWLVSIARLNFNNNKIYDNALWPLPCHATTTQQPCNTAQRVLLSGMKMRCRWCHAMFMCHHVAGWLYVGVLRQGEGLKSIGLGRFNLVWLNCGFRKSRFNCGVFNRKSFKYIVGLVCFKWTRRGQGESQSHCCESANFYPSIYCEL